MSTQKPYSTTDQNIPILWNHQKQSIGEALLLPEYALLHEAGTGKTRTLLEILRRKYASHNHVMNTLILCPQVVIKNWHDEILKYTKIPPHLIHMVRGDSKRKLSVLDNPTGIYITNYESMQNDKIIERLLKLKINVLVCDESHRVKNPKSKRAKAVLKIADSEPCLYRYLLTGTPVTNSPLDLYMQWRILDRGFTFGKNFYSFRGRYFEDINARWAGKPNYFPKWQPRMEMMLELSERLALKSSRVLKSECLDLPPLVKKTIEIEMYPEQRRVYNEMAKELVADVQSQLKSEKPHYLVAKMAMEKALRLQQITSGFVPVPKSALIEHATTQQEILEKLKQREVVYFEKNSRAEALSEILEDLTEANKVIVWACWEPNYKTIAQVCMNLGIQYRELHGGVTGEARDESIDSFRNDPNVRVLIANQAAGGIGINLIEASYSVYYSRNFSLEHDIQSEARNYRGGSEMHKSVTRIDLVAKGSVDEKVYQALQAKQEISSLLLDWDVSDLIGESNPWYQNQYEK